MNYLKLAGLGISTANRIIRPRMSHVNIALTMRCNHRCVMCSIWQNNAQAMHEIAEHNIAELIKNNDIMWISLTGGEPTLAREFKQILNRCVKNIKLTNMITNGSFPYMLENAVKQALNQGDGMLVVHISLLGNPKMHDYMVGVEGSFKSVNETIDRLKSIKSGRLIIGVEHTITSLNRFNYAWVAEYAQKKNIGLTYTIEQDADYYKRENAKLSKSEYPPITASFKLVDILKNTFLRKDKIKCVASEYSCFIMPDKTVYPCLFAIPNEPAFNLSKDGYKLKVDKFGTSQDYIKNCKGCWTPCESYSVLVYKPWRFL